jgi:hypothetical protein
VTRRQIETAVAQAGGRIVSIKPHSSAARPAGREGRWQVRCTMTEKQLQDFMGRLEKMGVSPAAKNGARPAGMPYYEYHAGQTLSRGDVIGRTTPAPAGRPPQSGGAAGGSPARVEPSPRTFTPHAGSLIEVQLEIE